MPELKIIAVVGLCNKCNQPRVVRKREGELWRWIEVENEVCEKHDLDNVKQVVPMWEQVVI